jgi:hypothetical protein
VVAPGNGQIQKVQVWSMYDVSMSINDDLEATVSIIKELEYDDDDNC